MELFHSDGILVPGSVDVQGEIPADPSDEKFLAAALDGDADVIVSGDSDLLNLGSFQNIVILTARQFVNSLRDE